MDCRIICSIICRCSGGISFSASCICFIASAIWSPMACMAPRNASAYSRTVPVAALRCS